MVEYGILLGFLTLALFALMSLLGEEIAGVLRRLANSLANMAN